MKNLIRNASVYRAHIKQDEAELRQALSETAFVDPLPSQEESYGFVDVDGEFLRTFPGGYAFTFRLDRKVIPSSALNAETGRIVKAIVEMDGRTPGRKEMASIKADARQNLTLKALTSSVHVNCYYQVAQNLLIVASTSQKLCDRLMSYLVKALETMKTSTIHVSVRAGLTTRLQQWVKDSGDSTAFGELEPTGRATLQATADGRNLSVKSDNLLTNIDALSEALSRSYDVKNLSLTLDGFEFVLTDAFKFSSLTLKEMPDAGGEDDLGWAASAMAEVSAIAKVVNALCEMFGHGEEAEGEQA